MTSHKKLINDKDSVVMDSLMGLVAAHTHLRLLRDRGTILPVVVRSDLSQIKHQQITLISGGGSGHEPAHVGYVGDGMLSAAICGHIFTSPDVDTILTTIRACTVALPKNSIHGNKVGCLLIVKNYTGDRLNFGLAAELARAEGFNVEMVIVGDDCAVSQTVDPSLKNDRDLRRGIAGTCFIHKLVGAYVSKHKGCSLSQVKQFAEDECNRVSSIGIGLSACIIPGNESSSFDLPSTKVEFGLGIHGEKGVLQDDIASADRTAEILLDYVIHDMKETTSKQVALLINNLGATTNLEMYIVCRKVMQLLEEQYSFQVERVYVGHFMTALDMSGVSLSVLSLEGDQHIQLLDEPTNCLAWPKNNSAVMGKRFDDSALFIEHTAQCSSSSPISDHSDQSTYQVTTTLVERIRSTCRSIIEHESILTEMDAQTGDGDMGMSFKRGANNILHMLDSIDTTNDHMTVSVLLARISKCVREMGGSSGVLLSILFSRMSFSFEHDSAQSLKESWILALGQGVEAVSKVGGAKVGDKTMMDVLIPVHQYLLEHSDEMTTNDELYLQLVQVSQKAMQNTKDMVGRKGRSAYLSKRVVGHVDPGAYAMTLIIEALSSRK